MQQRILNYRPTWNLNCTLPNSCDYYPITSTAYIKDANLQLTYDTQSSCLTSNSLLADRAEGCSSLSDGQLELMLHRRLLADDHQGVGEPLNDSTIIRTTHLVIVNRCVLVVFV